MFKEEKKRPKRKSGKLINVIFFVICVGFIWFAVQYYQNSSNDQSTSLAVTDQETIETTVTVASAGSQLFYPVRTAPASIEALNRSQIPAEITARVNQIHVRVGDMVSAGQLLVDLDCQDYQQTLIAEQARYDELTARLGFDQRELKRGEDLAKKQSISEAVVDQRMTTERTTQSQLVAQQSRVTSAQLNVKRCSLKAPFTGVILNRIANIGELVNPGTALIDLLQSDEQDIIAMIALTDIESFMQADSYLLNTQNNKYHLSLRSILPVVENQSQSQQARLNLSHTQILTTGATGRIEWTSPLSHLPARLLQQRNGQYGVFVINHDNRAKFIVIQNAQEGRPVAINLPADNRLAIDGRHGLSDGMSVTIAATEDLK